MTSQASEDPVALKFSSRVSSLSLSLGVCPVLARVRLSFSLFRRPPHLRRLSGLLILSTLLHLVVSKVSARRRGRDTRSASDG
jgi:hypothetical protein